MPTLFLSHGAPTLVMTKTPASEFLRSLASRVPVPKALLVVSAHWEEARPTVGLGVETIHDFYRSRFTSSSIRRRLRAMWRRARRNC